MLLFDVSNGQWAISLETLSELLRSLKEEIAYDFKGNLALFDVYLVAVGTFLCPQVTPDRLQFNQFEIVLRCKRGKQVGVLYRSHQRVPATVVVRIWFKSNPNLIAFNISDLTYALYEDSLNRFCR